jgi:hypothetical protein
VCDLEISKNEEAKARYWTVKIQPQWVVTPGKPTNKQPSLIKDVSNSKTWYTIRLQIYFEILCSLLFSKKEKAVI